MFGRLIWCQQGEAWCTEEGHAEAGMRSLRAVSSSRAISTGAQLTKIRESGRGGLYSDAKVANREIRVWHLVIENGY
jgi:hypothetical protein